MEVWRDELYHYGVKGQKWGIRRYQNPDGSLTPEGRKQARKEYRGDNKKAYWIGSIATITGKAEQKLDKRVDRAKKRAEKAELKDPEHLRKSTIRRLNKYADNLEALKKVSVANAVATDSAKKHCKSLIEKYGNEAVKPINYKDLKLSNGKKMNSVNERKLDRFSRLALLGGGILMSTAYIGVPDNQIYIVRGTTINDMAGYLADQAYYNAKKERKNKGR